MATKVKEIEQLEKLLLSSDLEELNLKTNSFNIFTALKLQNNEIRHSNFLGWLMSPYENHNLSDYFLKEFLKSAIKNFSQDDNVPLKLADVAFSNFSDAEIKREYKNIDVLITSHKNKFICIIENKIWSGEHSNQLERYKEIVKTYKDTDGYRLIYVFLTPNADFDQNELYKDYIQMDYGTISDIIDKTLKFKAENMNNGVKLALEQYKELIERYIMGNPDKNIVELCRKIYREHKEAINLINLHSVSRQAELREICEKIIRSNKDYTIDERMNKDHIVFTHKVMLILYLKES